MLLPNKISLLVLAIVFGLGATSAQEIELKDSVLGHWLCSRTPLAMNADCIHLDTVKAESAYPVLSQIHLSNKEIRTADELLYFVNVDTIYLNINQLSSFPQDISKFRSLGRLQLTANQLTSAPDIHYTNEVGKDTAVKLFYIGYNQLSLLPESWFQPNPFTQVIDLRNNYLTDIPSFVDYPEIRRLDVRENYLSFEELIPVMGHSKWGVEQFDLFPQRDFKVAIDKEVEKGETRVLNFSTGLASNYYELYKDEQRIADNREGMFEVTFEEDEDLYGYSVKINNDNFPDVSDFLLSEIFSFQWTEFVPPTDTIVVPIENKENVKEGDVYVFSPDGDGLADSFFIDGEGSTKLFDKNGTELRHEKLPYEWFGDNSSGVLQTPGLYFIQINEHDFLKVLISY